MSLQIVHRVESLFALADQLEARRQVDALKPLLLARAVRGKLVLQDLTDEPAEKVLGRVDNQPNNARRP